MAHTEFTGVVFDMDGVLFDTEPIHMRAWQEGLRAFGIYYDEEFFGKWVGIPDEDLGDWLEKNHGKGEHQGFLNIKRGIFRDMVRAELMPFEGVTEALEKVAATGIKMGVATSSQRTDLDLMLEVTNLGHFFSADTCYNDVIRHKPHPDPYLECTRRLGVDANTCAALEDSPSGVKAAKAAGMLTLAIRSTFDDSVLAEADKRFNTTPEGCEWLVGQIKDKGNP